MIWGALLSGVIMIHQFVQVPAQDPLPGSSGSSLWLVSVVPLTISSMIRWLVLPKVKSAPAALPVFIIGMALAEATFLLGKFLFPAHEKELMVLGVLGILQFIPIFASRFSASNEG